MPFPPAPAALQAASPTQNIRWRVAKYRALLNNAAGGATEAVEAAERAEAAKQKALQASQLRALKVGWLEGSAAPALLLLSRPSPDTDDTGCLMMCC